MLVRLRSLTSNVFFSYVFELSVLTTDVFCVIEVVGIQRDFSISVQHLSQLRIVFDVRSTVSYRGQTPLDGFGIFNLNGENYTRMILYCYYIIVDVGCLLLEMTQLLTLNNQNTESEFLS